MKALFITTTIYLLFSLNQNANATSPLTCDWLLTSGPGIVVTKIEDKSHLNESDYLIFYGDSACAQTGFIVKRENYNEATLREIKRSILISFAAKRKILFTPAVANFKTNVAVDLTKSITLQ